MHRARTRAADGRRSGERALRAHPRSAESRRAPRWENGGAPLLLYGHVDVVPDRRPAVDASAVRGRARRRHGLGPGRTRHEGRRVDDDHRFSPGEGGRRVPPGGLVLAVLSDEEAGGDFGAKFLAQEHPEALAGIRHALGEVGGVTVYMGGRRFYPIQVAEKRLVPHQGDGAWPGRPRGTAAPRRRDGASRPRCCVSSTASVRRSTSRRWCGRRSRRSPTRCPREGHRAASAARSAHARRGAAADGRAGRQLEGALRNTVNATIVRGGSALNVIPSEIEVEIDGRLLPGFGPDDLLGELRDIVGATSSSRCCATTRARQKPT